MDTNIDNNRGKVYPYHTPQQPHRNTARWGGLKSGGALMLAVTEPQVNQRPGDRVTDGGRNPVRTGRWD